MTKDIKSMLPCPSGHGHAVPMHSIADLEQAVKEKLVEIEMYECQKCGRPFAESEARAGYTICEHCDDLTTNGEAKKP